MRYIIFRYTLSTDLLDSIASPASFHNGSISRDSLPLRYVIFRRTLSTDLLDGVASPVPFHNGTDSRIFLPLRLGSEIKFKLTKDLVAYLKI